MDQFRGEATVYDPSTRRYITARWTTHGWRVTDGWRVVKARDADEAARIADRWAALGHLHPRPRSA